VPDDQPTTQLSTLCSARLVQQSGTATVELLGEFDITCEKPLRDRLEQLVDDETKTLVLDLRALEFIDSAGLRMLIVLDAQAIQDGFDFLVRCDNGNVMRVLKETGLDSVLPLVDPATDAPSSA
jgi:anti-sigma B factor antagonist